MAKHKTGWKIYRTKHLIQAKRLTKRCEVVDTLGRVVVGEPGDYLVAGRDGSRRIARKHIFEDIYVEMEETLTAWYSALERLEAAS